MTATEEIRTPQMEVLVKQGMGTESINISKLLTKVTLMDVSFLECLFLIII